jgi:serine/threonine protein kinase
MQGVFNTSALAIRYVILSGTFPFSSDDEDELFEEIAMGDVDVDGAPGLASVSRDAKCIIKGLLTRKPSKRMSVSTALSEPWLRTDETPSSEPLVETSARLNQMYT